MGLLVRVRDNTQGSEQASFFSTAPVRLGRNPLNDLTLDYGFVSQWHGVIKFDRNEIIFVDLGSTNGTLLDGQRVHERTPVRVSGPNSALSIGSLQITLRWADAAETGFDQKPRIKTQFATRLPLPAQATPAPQSSDVVPSSPAAPDASPSVGSQALDAPLTRVQEAQGSYRAYRESWALCMAELRQKIENAPPALREMTAFFMATEFPQVTKEPEFAAMLTELGVDRVAAGCFDIEDWLQRLTLDPAIASGKQASPAIAMEHVGALLEVFIDSFIELKKGYGQFETEMGLQINYDASPLDQATNPKDVIAHLLEPSADRMERLNELRRAFASFALHQVALLGASVEGARELLESLSPRVVAGTAPTATIGSNAITARAQGILSALTRTWPIGPIISWGRYKQAYDATTEGDRFTRQLFGRKFIRAYLALIGGQDRR